MTLSVGFCSFMPIYKGFNYVPLVFYIEEIENCHLEIKNRREISEQIIYNAPLFFQRYGAEYLWTGKTHIFQVLTSLLFLTCIPTYLFGAELVRWKVS